MGTVVGNKSIEGFKRENEFLKNRVDNLIYENKSLKSNIDYLVCRNQKLEAVKYRYMGFGFIISSMLLILAPLIY